MVRQFCQVWDEAYFAYLGLCRISTRMASSYVIREIDETSHTLYIEQQGIDTLYGVRSPPYESSAMPTTSEEICDVLAYEESSNDVSADRRIDRIDIMPFWRVAMPGNGNGSRRFDVS